MADLAHLKMESANGGSNGSATTDLSVAKSNDKTRSMIEQGPNSIETFCIEFRLEKSLRFHFDTYLNYSFSNFF